MRCRSLQPGMDQWDPVMTGQSHKTCIAIGKSHSNVSVTSNACMTGAQNKLWYSTLNMSMAFLRRPVICAAVSCYVACLRSSCKQTIKEYEPTDLWPSSCSMPVHAYTSCTWHLQRHGLFSLCPRNTNNGAIAKGLGVRVLETRDEIEFKPCHGLPEFQMQQVPALELRWHA